MTQYFDHKIALLSKIKLLLDPSFDALDSVDTSVVFDVSVCSEMPEFPKDLRERIHKTVLKYSAACQPVNTPGPCYETFEDHARGIISMVDELHTVFHDLAERGVNDPTLRGFSDDPTLPLRILYSRAEEKRELLV